MDFDWKSIANVVGKVAPLAGTLMGGPAGGAIGGMVAAVLGTANTPDAITQAIATDPEAALKLAQFESDNKVKLQAMMYAHADNIIAADTARYAAEVEDRGTARKASVDGGTSHDIFKLSVFLLLITLGTEICTLFYGYPKGVSEIVVGRVLGLMDSVALMVLAFHYGSTIRSARTSELLAASLPPGVSAIAATTPEAPR